MCERAGGQASLKYKFFCDVGSQLKWINDCQSPITNCNECSNNYNKKSTNLKGKKCLPSPLHKKTNIRNETIYIVQWRHEIQSLNLICMRISEEKNPKNKSKNKLTCFCCCCWWWWWAVWRWFRCDGWCVCCWFWCCDICCWLCVDSAGGLVECFIIGISVSTAWKKEKKKKPQIINNLNIHNIQFSAINFIKSIDWWAEWHIQYIYEKTLSIIIAVGSIA